MNLILITEEHKWTAFAHKHAPRSGAFLQSWAWGEFQAAVGRKVKRFAWEMDGQLSAVAQVMIQPTPIAKNYAYCPRGPLLERGWSNEETYVHLKELGNQVDAAFVRFEPPWPAYPVRKHFVKTLDLQPPDTLITDLRVTSAARHAAMQSKTRYNIRLAERHGVEIEISPTVSFDEVWPLFETTAKRGGFHLHPKKYYETMLSVLSDQSCRAFLAVARHKGNLLAANIMIDDATTRTYLHGASSNEQREVMAPHLLHNCLIEDAVQKGLQAYDWWGIAPETTPNPSLKKRGAHPWAGVTRFKLGFGGERVSYPGTFDAVYHPARYGMYVLARRARRLV